MIYKLFTIRSKPYCPPHENLFISKYLNQLFHQFDYFVFNNFTCYHKFNFVILLLMPSFSKNI